MNIPEEKAGLDSSHWSKLWLDCLDRALPFHAREVGTISSIVPLPDLEEVLIFADDKVFHQTKSSLQTVLEIEREQGTDSKKILESNVTGSLKGNTDSLPWISLTNTLFAIEKCPNSLWLHPLKIQRLYDTDHGVIIEMLEGPNISLAIQKEQFLSCTEQALAPLFILWAIKLLDCTKTPFLVSLMTRPFLREVLHSFYGEVNCMS